MINITDFLFKGGMCMKVIILTDYGNNSLPKEFKADYNNKLWRMNKELIDRIESFNWIKIGYQEKDKIVVGQNYAIDYKGNINCSNVVEYIYATSGSSVPFISFCIEEVDISRPWCIEEYDGAEGIKYLDAYKCVDKELNYFELGTD